MARVSGVNIPKKKRLVIALTYIYGIGLTTAKNICKQVKFSEDMLVETLSDDQLVILRNFIDQNCLVEGEARKIVNLNIKTQKDIGSYRGRRHSRRLPVRGQNTKSNARTRKGKAVPIAGKKK